MATFAKPGTTTGSAEECKIDMDGTLPTKRKPEVIPSDNDNIKEVGDKLVKKQKLEIPSIYEYEFLAQDVEDSKGVSEAENSGIQLIEEVEDEGDEDEDEEDYEDEDEDGSEDSDGDEEEEQQPNDPKGKGILKDEKGKGKLIEESGDSGDSGTGSDGESDLSDDPLTEVDLNNILPSRTRGCAIKPGVSISIDRRSKEDKDNDTTP